MTKGAEKTEKPPGFTVGRSANERIKKFLHPHGLIKKSKKRFSIHQNIILSNQLITENEKEFYFRHLKKDLTDLCVISIL